MANIIQSSISKIRNYAQQKFNPERSPIPAPKPVQYKDFGYRANEVKRKTLGGLKDLYTNPNYFPNQKRSFQDAFKNISQQGPEQLTTEFGEAIRGERGFFGNKLPQNQQIVPKIPVLKQATQVASKLGTTWGGAPARLGVGLMQIPEQKTRNEGYKNIAMGGLGTGLTIAGAKTITPKFAIGSAGIGSAFGGAGKLYTNYKEGRPLTEGLLETMVGQGIESGARAVPMSTILKFTSPVIEQIGKYANTSDLFKNIPDALRAQIMDRVLGSALNVGEGLIIDRALDLETDAISVGTDILTGAAMGTQGVKRLNSKQSIRQAQKELSRSIKESFDSALKTALKSGVDEYKALHPEVSDREALNAVKDFWRNEKGQFVSPPKKDTFIKDSKITDADRIALRRKYGLPEDGNYSRGFIDLDAEVGGAKPEDPKQIDFNDKPKVTLDKKGQIKVDQPKVKIPEPDTKIPDVLKDTGTPMRKQQKIRELAQLKEESLSSIKRIDEILANYDLYKKRFSSVMTKTELRAEKKRLLGDIKQIDSEIRNTAPKTTPISKNIPTPEEVSVTLDSRINALTEKTAGYSTLAPEGGAKSAGKIATTMRNMAGKVSTQVEKGLTSKYEPVRKAASVLHGFFKELGTSPERYKQNLELSGGISATHTRVYDVMEALYNAIGNSETSKARIDAVLDPEASKLKVSVKDLTPKELEVYNLIKEGLGIVHDMSYANGGISPEMYKQNLGKYNPRLYKDFEVPPEINKFINSSSKKMQTDLYRKKGDLTEWKKENKLDDPIYAMGKRLTQVETNRAIKKYTDFIATQPHLVSDVERKGFTKLSDSPAYGELRGKYVANSAVEELKGHFFANEGLNALYDAFRWYDRMPIRQLQKKLLTIFNPTTNVGNVVTDNVFGFLVGVDPYTLNKNILELKKNPSSYKQIANYLRQEGIIGTDITKTDFVNRVASIDDLATGNKKGIFAKISDKASSFYGGTDDVYKAAALKSLLDQGKTLDEATRLVSDGFQNYASVGKFYDFASKIPVVGQPFIKFQGDLIRIAKNAAINRPLHLITFLATLKGISILSSKLSGETDEERKARESRFGTKNIPGLNIPLNWQTPIGEIDVARYISPFYATNLNEGQGGQVASKLLPFVSEIKTDSSGNFDLAGTLAANANDPLVAPLIQASVNRDFRNKPISDPKASKYFGSDLPVEEQQMNTAKWLGRAYLPPQVNSVIDVGSAAQGKENMYGQTQSVPQALARVAGIKIQQATPEIVQKQADISKYYDAKDPAFNKLNATEKAAVLSIPKQEPDDFQAKMMKYQTLLQYPATYNYLKEIAINKVDGDMSKVDPIYSYPYSDVRKYMLYQSKGGSALGDSEAKALYKAEPVIGEISQARSAYYEKNPIEGSEYSSSRPVASVRAQAQMDAGNWNDPEVKAYLEANTAWKNMNREKVGLPPLESFASKFGGYTRKPQKAKFNMGKVKKARVKKLSGAFKTRKIKTPKLKAISAPRIRPVAKITAPKIRSKFRT